MNDFKKLWEKYSVYFAIIARRKVAAISVALALIVFMPVAFVSKGIDVGSFLDICPEYNIPVKQGDTLGSLLGNFGLPHNEIVEIDRTIKKDAKIRSLSAGKDILRVYKRDDSPIERIVLNCGPLRQINVGRDESGQWRASVLDRMPEVRIVRREGTIKDGDSFYAAGQRAGIPLGVITEVYDLFSFEIDFERDVRAGQSFYVLYEEFWTGGQRIATGSVVFAEFDTLRGKTKMYRFKKSDGKAGYYDANAKGAIKSLKRTPINNARVSSSFTLNRRHPVLGFNRAHRGVDFRAGHGTPIPSAGAGRVVRKGYDTGYGNFIQIRHGGSFETLYAHMSGFARGVGVGTYVRQGQIIGYVGSTGLSTGPHLHYEIIQSGVKVNPMSVKLPAIDNLAGKDVGAFFIERDIIDAHMKKLRPNDPKSYIKMQ
ncbi:MAG: peptidoglycan DD-metalloendopeptidase family protein [Rickettsiales bacterium]|jgi:murein DD-endopeptidase MepM/ murein hydrolase activator NlpD|nr:peptidoglycan DD-metalloendopeptidase family protein [Rickettsiales bacterium]